MRLVKHKTPYLIMRFYDDIPERSNAMVLKIDERTIPYLKKYDAAAQAASDKLSGEFCSLEIEEFPFAYFMSINTDKEDLFKNWKGLSGFGNPEIFYLEATEDEFDELYEKYESEYYFRDAVRFYGNGHFAVYMIVMEDDLIAHPYLSSGMLEIKDVEQ